MQEATVEAPGWAPGDAVGISWLLSDVAGLQVVGTAGRLSGSCRRGAAKTELSTT